MSQRDSSARFDHFAPNYESHHTQSVRASGEHSRYFSRYKLRCIERLLGETFDEPILDYGCGIGLLTQELAARYSQVDGFDPSHESIREARSRVPRAAFYEDAGAIPADRYALVVLAGVLHHVPPLQREAVTRLAASKLRVLGQLVAFEHNPMNPVTRRAVELCPFDEDAVLLWPREARCLLRRAGL